MIPFYILLFIFCSIQHSVPATSTPLNQPDNNNCNVALEEIVTFFGKEGDVYEKTLRITNCDADAAEAVRTFWKTYSVNRAVLWTLLDYVCILNELPCELGTELFRGSFATVPSAGEIVIHIGDNVATIVAEAIARIKTTMKKEENDMFGNSREFIITRKVCSLLTFTCKAQQIGQTGQVTAATISQLDASFETVERETRMTQMEVLSNLAGDVGMVEGNLWTDSSLGDVATLRKRECAVFATSLLLPAPTTFLEIGFNAGHSLSMFLQTIPTLTRVVEFDICMHGYVRSNFKLVETKFPMVNISLICGDSKKTLGDYSNNNPTSLFGKEKMVDVIHIDGGHDFDTAWLDIVNSGRFARRLSHKNSHGSPTLLIIDNVDHARSLEGAVAAAVDANVIQIIGSASGACRYGSLFAWYQ